MMVWACTRLWFVSSTVSLLYCSKSRRWCSFARLSWGTNVGGGIWREWEKHENSGL